MKNLGQMMKQAQELQAKMGEMQDKLAALEVTGISGGGMIEVTLNGKHEVRRVKIDPSLAGPSDVEVLEDLIVAAFSDASARRNALRRNPLMTVAIGSRLARQAPPSSG